jgi:hypothetical protein
MTSDPDRIAELERKPAFLQDCHREQVRYLMKCIFDLEYKIQQLSSLVPVVDAIEKLALDAHTASNDQVQDALVEIDRSLPSPDCQLFVKRAVNRSPASNRVIGFSR